MNRAAGKVICILAGLFFSITSNVYSATLVTYYHTDALGSPVAATDEYGNNLWDERYQPYGERIEKDTPSSDNHLWFTGKPADEQTGLSYFGARYYDPVIGRFLSADPVDFQEANLHSFNRYAYANNNPYKYVDPDGNEPIFFGVFRRGQSMQQTLENSASTHSGLLISIAGLGSFATVEYSFLLATPIGRVVVSEVGREVFSEVTGIPILPKKVNPSDLIPTQPLTKSRKQMKRLSNEIDEVGEITESLKYVERDGKKYLVDGHHRQALARQKGITEVPAEQVELPYGGYKTDADLEFSQY